MPPKIHLSTEEEVKDISEDPISQQNEEIEKGTSCLEYSKLNSKNLILKFTQINTLSDHNNALIL